MSQKQKQEQAELNATLQAYFQGDYHYEDEEKTPPPACLECGTVLVPKTIKQASKKLPSDWMACPKCPDYVIRPH